MAEQNPFLSLFPSHEDAQRAEQSTEKEAHELDKTLVRILLINGHGELQEQRCFDHIRVMSVLPRLPSQSEEEEETFRRLSSSSACHSFRETKNTADETAA